MDPSGNPVEGIEVIAAPLLGMLLGSTTDEDGFFAINGVGAGTYEVSTRENDGPTCASCPFYSGGHPGQWFATVRVLKGQVASNIVLQTPPRFAKLTVLVLDAVTKRPIVGSLITLRRADMPDYFLQTGADTGGYLTEPVPLVPIMIEVVVEGYEPWNCVADYLPPQLTRVGESRKVEAHLRKQAS